MNVDNSFTSDAYKDITASTKKKIEDSKDLKAKDISNQYFIEYQMQITSESKV